MGYAKDYPMEKIKSWETINSINVPLGEDGEYLDHEEISDDRTHARRLTSPYGMLAIVIGLIDDFTCFDFNTLPDGDIVLDATLNSETGSFIQSAGYQRCSREEALTVALGFVDEAVQWMADNEVKHDEYGWNADVYYFARCVAKTLDIKPFDTMKDAELRRNTLIPGG